MYSKWIVTALGLVGLAGCGAEDSTAPARLPIAPESFAAEYVSAVCAQAGRCWSQAPYLIEQCEARRELLLGDVQSAVEAGRIAYDAGAARDCIDGIATTDCMTDAFSDDTLGACFAALKGKVEPGGECYSLFECAKGFCDSASSGQCPSTCPQVLGEGEHCALHFGPACDWRAGLRCSGGACVKPAGIKEPCADNSGCQTGLVCTTTGEGTKSLCRPLHKAKGLCSSDATCASGLYCNGDDEGGECAARLTEGGACGLGIYTIDAALRGVQCAEGLVCQGAGITRKGEPVAGQCARPAGEGGPCLAERADSQIHVSGCQTGLVCSNGTCVLSPSEGPCAPHHVCRSGVAYCDSTQTCTPLKPSGEACRRDGECAGKLCVNSVCEDAEKRCSAP